MTASTSGMARLLPSKIYDSVVILPSTLEGLRPTALENTPQTQLTVKIMTIKGKKFSAEGFVQFACTCPYWRTHPHTFLILALFKFKAVFPINITQFYKATPWLRLMTDITGTKK
jgi:hypothetical protein